MTKKYRVIFATWWPVKKLEKGQNGYVELCQDYNAKNEKQAKEIAEEIVNSRNELYDFNGEESSHRLEIKEIIKLVFRPYLTVTIPRRLRSRDFSFQIKIGQKIYDRRFFDQFL